jgi:hypothetical protein
VLTICAQSVSTAHAPVVKHRPETEIAYFAQALPRHPAKSDEQSTDRHRVSAQPLLSEHDGAHVGPVRQVGQLRVVAIGEGVVEGGGGVGVVGGAVEGVVSVAVGSWAWVRWFLIVENKTIKYKSKIFILGRF